MPVQNLQIAKQLDDLADLLEIQGENRFKIRAYRNAARSISDMPVNLATFLEEGETLPPIPGVGESIAGKIQEIVQTGHLAKLEQLERSLPVELAALMAIPGLGPKKVMALYEQLGIQNLKDLRLAVAAHQIRSLPGFGEKTEANIRKELDRHFDKAPRLLLSTADKIARPLLDYLNQIPGVQDLVIAGSYRRRKETVGDLDILITCQDGIEAMANFLNYEDITDIVSKGPTRSTVLLRSGVQVDVRIVSQESYGAALVYFTGSKAHNIKIRTMAVQQGLKINEYGVFRENQRISGKTETEVYQSIGLPYIPPELREDRGEIEAALNHQLPQLITVKAIKGDLHAHTKASDGRNSLEEMAQAAKDKGYEYLAITDHTKSLAVAGGLTEKRLMEQMTKIDQLNEQLHGLLLLKSAEVDILEDGRLDLSDAILKELDWVVCSVHSRFNLSREKQTERLIRAMNNPYMNALAHPTGRLINEREPYEVDLKRIMKVALETGCYLEVNAQPKRLDLNDMNCKMAKDMGVKVVISTDAHSTTDFNNLRYGVDQAQRGWLEPDDVINTRSWRTLKSLLKKK